MKLWEYIRWFSTSNHTFVISKYTILGNFCLSKLANIGYKYSNMFAPHDHTQIWGLKWVNQEKEGDIRHKIDVLIEKSKNPYKTFFWKKVASISNFGLHR